MDCLPAAWWVRAAGDWLCSLSAGRGCCMLRAGGGWRGAVVQAAVPPATPRPLCHTDLPPFRSRPRLLHCRSARSVSRRACQGMDSIQQVVGCRCRSMRAAKTALARRLADRRPACCCVVEPSSWWTRGLGQRRLQSTALAATTTARPTCLRDLRARPPPHPPRSLCSPGRQCRPGGPQAAPHGTELHEGPAGRPATGELPVSCPPTRAAGCWAGGAAHVPG